MERALAAIASAVITWAILLGALSQRQLVGAFLVELVEHRHQLAPVLPPIVFGVFAILSTVTAVVRRSMRLMDVALFFVAIGGASYLGFSLPSFVSTLHDWAAAIGAAIVITVAASWSAVRAIILRGIAIHTGPKL